MKLVFTGLLVFVSFSFVQAQQPGTLNPAFGKKGIASYPLINYYSNETVTVANKGKLYAGTLGPYKGFTYTFRLDALLPDGSVDSSFGEQGSAYALFSGMADTANTNKLAAIISLAGW